MKVFATTICVVVLCVQSLACDVCGAVNSSLGLGTAAWGNRHTIGLTYQYRTYASNHPPLFNEPAVRSSERFQRLDLSGTIRLADRWQLKAIVPIVYNEQTKEGVRQAVQGLGDPMLTIHYFIINRQDSLGNQNIRWSVGAGGKLPAGRFAEPHNEILLLYPGTGTWDVVAQSSLYLRSSKWGMIQEINAVFRSTNKYGYTPGSLFNATLFGFRRFSNWSVFGGFQYAWNGIDYIDRTSINSSPSQGTILSATIGGTIQWGKVLVQANYHLPVAQHLGNGYTTQQASFTAGIHYLF
jgi:hypothetical protein